MKKSFNLIKNLILSLLILVAVASVQVLQAKGAGHGHGKSKAIKIKSAHNGSYFFNMKKYLIKQNTKTPRQNGK